MRVRSTILIGAILVTLVISTVVAGEQQLKRVLMLHSFGPDFGDLYSKDLRAELDRELPGRLDLYEEWLVSARFSTPENDAALGNYLSSLFADHPLDLIITLGAPAASFVQKYRQTLFARTPELLADVEERRVDSAGLQEEETSVADSISFPVVVEGILRVLPQTTTLAIVIGNSTIEKYWVGQIRDSLQPFKNRLTVTFLNELSFDEVLKRVATLPPGSAIFYVMLSQSVSGIPEDEDVALARLHAAADAPIFSYSDAYLGKGIVGGPLLSTGEQVQTIGSVAIRILRGEHASAIKTPPLQLGNPQYDWRELKRWHIRASALPSGSSIRFVEASAWEQYRWQIAAGGILILLQTILIFSLLYERSRRENAEHVSRQRLAEVARLNRLSTAGELSASIAHELRQPLSAILINSEEADVILNSETPNITELKAIVNDIKRDDRRASEVITRLGRLFRRVPNETQDVDLNDVVREVFGFLSWLAAARQITLSTSFAQPAPLVRGDAIQLQQVILNLLMNAIDAIQDAKSRQRTIVGRTAVLDGRFAEVSIEDSGPGIPAGREKEIFQPFFTTKESGMGMGLAIVRTIVENHGGQIGAENRAQGGAVIRFTLPLVKAQHSREFRQGY
jgi:signal transduction histidine kinase